MTYTARRNALIAMTILLMAGPAMSDKGLSLPKLPISLLSDGIPDIHGKDDAELANDDDSDAENSHAASNDDSPPPPGRVKTEKSTAKLPLPILDQKGQARTLAAQPAAPTPTEVVDPQDVSKQVVPVTPGVVEVQQIAIGHLNRIEAPFDNPQVRTVSNVEIKIIDRIIYVMTNDPGPLSMYITTPDESIALSLALLARKIPPRDMRIVLNQPAQDGLLSAGAPNPMARKLEEAQPYVDALREIIATTAKGEIPQGYSFQELRTDYARDIHYCQIEGLEIVPRQRLDGHNYIITVSQVLNPTVFLTEIDESLCYREGIVAVAAWPQVVLRPGEQTELIIVQRREVFKPSYSTPRRPSAIGG